MSELTQYVAAALFAIAVCHTFAAKLFEKLAHRYPAHHGVFHLLGEVEAVFGFWSIILFAWLIYAEGFSKAVEYADTRNYTEPLFVFAIMVIAASKPVMFTAKKLVESVANALPINMGVARYFVLMTFVPLLGSFITEPAAMTLGALMLLQYFQQRGSNAFKYGTIGVLFVNVSIGGTLTHFAAPPVLMVAATWNWDTFYMFTHFGWKAAIAVFINGAVLTLLFRQYLTEAGAQIINVGSESIAVPFVMLSLYQTSKAGLEMFSNALEAELEESGIRVTVVRAGPMYDESKEAPNWDRDAAMRFHMGCAKNGLDLRTRPVSHSSSVTGVFRAVLDLPPDVKLSHVTIGARKP